MMESFLPEREMDRLIKQALEEDIGRGDITSQYVIPSVMMAEFVLSNREDIVVCGMELATYLFDNYTFEVDIEPIVSDGEKLPAKSVLMKGEGNAREILAVERVVLNLLQHLSGIATLTHRYVEAVKGTRAIILDTRKTLPGLRHLEKWAVRAGGGRNHRFCLDDGVLIKDNHIEVAGSITKAVEAAKRQAPALTMIEVECENLDQVKEALAAGAERIMLDNMSLAAMKEAVQYVNGRVALEASGNVNLENVRAIAETGVDFISIGKLTHSAPSSDIGLDIVITK